MIPEGAPILSAEERMEDHLRRLVASWGLLADLAFADLLLFRRRSDRFVITHQVRPTTGPTVYLEDRVGRSYSAADRGVIATSFESGTMASDDRFERELGGRVSTRAVPVVVEGTVAAVLARDVGKQGHFRLGGMERTYQRLFDRFALMIAEGLFPYPPEAEAALANPPRIGDGVVLLDPEGGVRYASPNAVSALTRAGYRGSVVGQPLPDELRTGSRVEEAHETRLPTMDEVTLGGVTLDVRCLPVLTREEVTGTLVVLRDVTEVRSRDRLLLSKDAAIAEIHHRVKNNLQTISSLLRLQGRRLTEPSAKAAIDESVQRIRTIAAVHEILSREHGDDVYFGDILEWIVRSLNHLSGAVRISGSGRVGRIPSLLATPLAVVMNELIQNSLDHAFSEDGHRGAVEVTIRREGPSLVLTVADDGSGLPGDFDASDQTGLGLSIVRSLVVNELGGELSIRNRDPGSGSGTVATVRVTPREVGATGGQDARR